MTDQQSASVMVWWAALTAVSVVNVCAWVLEAVRVRQAGAADSAELLTGRRRQLLLSALFVLGCGFRSVFPRVEAQRLCLFDTWLSAAVIGRAVATVAELCFVVQWTLVLRGYARTTKSPVAGWIWPLLVPLIATAELCSWYATLTTNYVGGVLEESLWALSAALMTGAFIDMWWRDRRMRQAFIAAALVFNAFYVVFMCTVDVPMYWERWKADQRAARVYVPLDRGWQDGWERRIVSRRWTDWRQEVPWMSLYFSAGVWISMALVRAPHLGGAGPRTGPRTGPG